LTTKKQQRRRKKVCFREKIYRVTIQVNFRKNSTYNVETTKEKEEKWREAENLRWAESGNWQTPPLR
jgi:hypothetical protein